MEQKQEILRLLSYQEILKLIKMYNTSDEPSSTRGLNFLLTQKKILDLKAEHGTNIFKSDREKYNFYTHKNGHLKNGTYIAICGKLDYCLFISSLQESGEEIRECISKTNLIEWNLGPFFLSTYEKDAVILLDYIKQKKYPLEFANWNIMVYQPREEALRIKYDTPSEDVYLAPLKIEDCELIDEIWPHRYIGSLEYIQDMVIHNGGIGLYSKDSNKLLCWVMKNDLGAPGYVLNKF